MRTNTCVTCGAGVTGYAGGAGSAGRGRACDGRGALVIAAFGWLVAVALRVRRPQGEVVTQKLHYQRRVLVRVLVEGVQLSDRVVESLQIRHQSFGVVNLTHYTYIDTLMQQI
ncbi:hypothetical protein EVAR_78958_1 [Eumeta japonica]|uniref:Uncharacterized protein n=1 Tax=Eumeta variegata TaxID=151549 RepID=A0A4C1UTW6_EUMVA|nr:hypothetical protein EVAR_78958_1 [Eumeta japonica]